jgi:RHS repeat-associated protein
LFFGLWSISLVAYAVLSNASGQVLSRSWPSTETWTYGYTSGKLTSVSDGYGVRQLQFSYISNPGQFDDGQLWRVGDHSASGLSGGSPTGRFVEFGYVTQKSNGTPIGSPKALLSTVKDVMGKTWTYKYYGQVAGQSDANLLDFMIEILSPNVDPTGAGGAGSPIALQQLTYTVSGGQVTSLVQNRGDGLLSTTFTFQPGGQNITTETTAGKTTTHTFANGVYASVQDPAGNVSTQLTNFQYRPDRLTDPNGQRTEFVWSPDGKLLQQAIDALGQAERFIYNTNDTVNYSLDAEGRKTQFTYGDVNNPRLPTRVQMYDKDGTTVLRWLEFTYDSKGRVLTQKLYNTAGSIVQQQMDYAYYNSGNGNGLLQTTTEKDLITPANNVVTTYFYDTLARVVKVSQASTFGPCKISYTVYDAADHVVASLCNYDPGLSADPTTVAEAIALFNPATPDKNRVTSYAFDPLGRQISMTVDAGASYALTTLTGYDSMSRATRSITSYVAVPGINDPYVHQREAFTHGEHNDQNLIVDGVYNERGQLKRQTDAIGHTTLFGYDDAGRLVRTVRYASQPTYDNSYAAGGDPTLQKYAWIASDLPHEDILTSTEYDAAGNAMKTTDAIGNVTLIGYDALHRPVRVIQNASQPTYDRIADPTLAAYVPVSAADQDLATVTEYDALSRVRRTQDVMGNTTLFGFDGLGRLVKTIRYTSQPTYDLAADPSLSRYEASTAADQDLVAQVTYDPAERVMFTTDILGRKTWQGYDGLGRTVRTITNAVGTATDGSIHDPRSATYGAVISASDVDQIALTNFDASGRVWRTQDVLGNWTLVGFDSVDRVIRVIRNASNPNYDATTDAALDRYQPAVAAGADQDLLTQTRYNAQGRVEATIDPAGNETRFVYDALGRTLKTIVNFTTGTFDPTYPDQDLTTVTAYDLGSRVVSTVDVRGTQTTFEHDKACRQRKVTEAAGTTLARTTYTCFDKAGRTLRVIQNWIFDPAQPSPDARDAQGDWLFNPGTHGTNNDQNLITTFTLDKTGRPVAVMDAVGNTASVAYSKDSQVEAATDQAGFIAKIRYDKARRQKTIVQGYLASTFNDPDTWIWDSANARWEDGAGTAITFGMANDRNSITQVEYDKAGRTLAMRDPRGNRTTYSYDLLDRRTELIDPLNHTWTTAYTQRNGTLQVDLTNPLGEVTRQQTDRLGRLAQVQYLDESPKYTPDVTFRYDKLGNRTEMLEEAGVPVRITAFQYDKANRLTRADFDIDGDGGTDEVVLYDYDAAGLRTKLTLPGDLSVSYSYNALAQLTSLTNWNSQTAQYTYDGVGRPLSTVRSGLTSAFTFDAANRLTRLQHTSSGGTLGDFAYTLDARGNRTGVVETQAQAPSGSETHNLTYAYDALSRLSQAVQRNGGTLGSGTVQRQDDYTYDRASNRTQQVVTISGSPTTTNYTFDAANRLSSDGTHTFTWDDAGRLTDDENGAYTYIWDRANRLLSFGDDWMLYNGLDQRVERSEGATTTHYLPDMTADPWTVLATNADGNVTYFVHDPTGLLQQIAPSSVSRWMVKDGLGSIRGVVNDSAVAQESRQFAPYGDPHSGTGSSQTAFGFTGELTDSNSLVYLRARYFSPAIGQFISLDPAETANRYAYVMGNPVNRVDPSGLRLEMGTGGIGGGLPKPPPPLQPPQPPPPAASGGPSGRVSTKSPASAKPAQKPTTGSEPAPAATASPASWGGNGGRSGSDTLSHELPRLELSSDQVPSNSSPSSQTPDLDRAAYRPPDTGRSNTVLPALPCGVLILGRYDPTTNAIYYDYIVIPCPPEMEALIDLANRLRILGELLDRLRSLTGLLSYTMERAKPVAAVTSQTQTCSDARRTQLNAAMHNTCDQPRSCDGLPFPPPCGDIQNRIRANRACAADRRNLAIECFGDTFDVSHANAYNDVVNVLNDCIGRYEYLVKQGKCPPMPG